MIDAVVPEIVGSSWYNGSAMKLSDLKGKCVLVVFWSFSSSFCLDTIPYINAWYEAYHEHGLVIIGVHSPQFAFEKSPESVQKEIKKHAITWPVVLDNNAINARNFGAIAIPSFYIIDKNGVIVAERSSAGGYEEAEDYIRAVLFGSEDNSAVPRISLKEHVHTDECFLATPTLSCGYTSGVIGNKGSYHRDIPFTYYLSAHMPDNTIVLSGSWIAAGDYIESHETNATINLKFEATKINLVLSSQTSENFVEILLNGEKLPADLRGDDVDENSLVHVQEGGVFTLLHSPVYASGVLSIKVQKPGIRAYIFTFSGCVQ